jgi:predicted nucleic acid-binding protein
MMNEYFYDTYAIISFLRQSKNYESYFKSNLGITSFYNALEVYYFVLKEQGEERANLSLKLLMPIVVYPKIEDISLSMKFKLKNKLKKFSYTDCLGYVIALRCGMKFLTGDKGFENMFNVEFVKE